MAPPRTNNDDSTKQILRGRANQNGVGRKCAFAGGNRIPYLGVAAHADWADQNPALVAKLYATYKAAAEWIAKNPDEAAPLVAPGASAEDIKSMASLIRSNERLAMSLAGANDIRNEIEAVYKAGIDVGYFPVLPSSTTVYGKPIP